MKLSRILAACVLVLWVVAFTQVLWAKPAVQPNSSTKMFDYGIHDKNNIRFPFTNKGQFGQNPLTGRAGTEWPLGSGNYYIYGGGIWIGAKINGHKTVTIGYNPNDGSFEFEPGIIGASVSDDRYHCWLSDAFTGNWPVQKPGGGNDIRSVQDSWCDYNDANPAGHDAFHTPGDELNVYVEQTGYIWNFPDNSNIIFLVFNMTNHGSVPWDSAYVGVTFDPDLGNAVDDMVGSDPSRNLAYVYNASSVDQDINGTPGLMGCRFIESPEGLTSFTIFTLSSDPTTDVERYNAMAGLSFSGAARPGGPYDTDVAPEDKRFCQASGPFTLLPDSSVRVVIAICAAAAFDPSAWDPATLATNLKHTADVAQSIYNANFILPSAPTSPEVNVGIHNSRVYLTWGDISETEADPYAAVAYDSTSALYFPWYIANDFEGYRIYRSQTGFPDDWQMLGEYDIVDGIYDGGAALELTAHYAKRDSTGAWIGFDSTITVPPDIDTNTSDLGRIPYRYHIGTDNGVRHFFQDSTAIPGMTYYYAVTAYDWQPGALHTLESGKTRVAVKISTNPAGFEGGATVEHLSQGLSEPRTGHVEVSVFDPALLTGHNYEVIFQRRNEPVDGMCTYALVDVTANDTLYTDSTYQSGGLGNYPTTDNFIAEVFGRENYTYTTPASDWSGLDTAATVALGGSPDADLAITEDMIWLINDNYGPYCDWDDFQIQFIATRVETVIVADSLVFPDSVSHFDAPRVYWFDAAGDTIWSIRRRFIAASFGEYGMDAVKMSVPFAMYDLGNGPGQTPLRVWPVVYDYPATGTGTNMVWDLGDAILKLDHYFYMMPDPADTLSILWADAYNNGNTDNLFARFAPNRSNHGTASYRVNFDLADTLPGRANFWNSKQAYTFRTINGNEPGDVYTINTIKAGVNAAKATSELNNIKVVPNPYIVRNEYETDPNNAVLRFTHLPEVCTVRIYTQSGNLIKTLEHNMPGTQNGEIVWNMLTYNDQIPAGGVYIYYVDAPGTGTHTGRFAIVK